MVRHVCVVLFDAQAALRSFLGECGFGVPHIVGVDWRSAASAPSHYPLKRARLRQHALSRSTADQLRPHSSTPSPPPPRPVAPNRRLAPCCMSHDTGPVGRCASVQYSPARSFLFTFRPPARSIDARQRQRLVVLCAYHTRATGLRRQEPLPREARQAALPCGLQGRSVWQPTCNTPCGIHGATCNTSVAYTMEHATHRVAYTMQHATHRVAYTMQPATHRTEARQAAISWPWAIRSVG